MSELRETDPRLVAVRDKQTGRDLLDSSHPNPLVIDTRPGRPVRFALVVENGPEGLMDLTITSDESWLVPEAKRLTLVGGESDVCIVTAAPDGDAEFANLLFSWQGAEKPLSASVMLMRKLPPSAGAASAGPAEPASRQAGTYQAEISRENPTCFLFLVDRSGSMAKPFPGTPQRTKAHSVADALNRLLHELVSRCSKGIEILDRYDIGVIGYGDEHVVPALGGALSGRRLVPVSEIAKHPLRVEKRTKKQPDGVGGLVETTVMVPVWYQAAAQGRTPMCAAFTMAYEVIDDFIRKHPRCFPPVVINITDGKPSDADPRPKAAALRSLASEDGNVLLFNLHITSTNAQPIQFPVQEAVLPDKYARILFRMSSPIPPNMLNQARAIAPDIAEGARGFVLNADIVATIQMLEIGTMPSKR
jgi:hypothetical protein